MRHDSALMNFFRPAAPPTAKPASRPAWTTIWPSPSASAAGRNLRPLVSVGLTERGWRPAPLKTADTKMEQMAFSHAQINIGRLVASTGAPRLADFVAQLDPVNKLADAAPGPARLSSNVDKSNISSPTESRCAA